MKVFISLQFLSKSNYLIITISSLLKVLSTFNANDAYKIIMSIMKSVIAILNLNLLELII